MRCNARGTNRLVRQTLPLVIDLPFPRSMFPNAEIFAASQERGPV